MAWGANALGQLGDGLKTNKHIPTQIGTETNWALVSGGNEHTIALKKNGTLWAWGYNTDGQLGDNTDVSHSLPVQIGTENTWAKAEAGSNHNHAIKSDGSLWGWGLNERGSLGDGTTTSRYVPVQIGTAVDWIHLFDHEQSFGLKTDGSLWAWGNNGSGQLGDGSNQNKYVPTAINCPVTVGLEDIELANLKIYPNPTNDIINILVEKDIILNIALFDIQGRMIASDQVNDTHFQIDLSNYQNVVYLLKVTTNKGSEVLKLFKE